MSLPIVFRKAPEGAIASYDYYDISEGTGMKEFFCGTSGKTTDTPNAASSIYYISNAILFQNQFYSNDIETFHQNAGGQAMKMCFGFLLAPFNQPKIIKGKAYFQGSIYRDAVGTDNTWFNEIKLQKVSGTTVTDLNTATSGAVWVPLASGADFIEIPITGTHNFKIGDQLKLYFETQYVYTPDSEGVAITHDPMDRDGTYIKPSVNSTQTSQMKLWVPFKIEL